MLTASQRSIARKVAFKIPGATYDPPAVLIDGPVSGATGTDTVGDVSDVGMELISASVGENTETQSTLLPFSLRGPVPPNKQYQYTMLVDLDGNAATGGSSAGLGLRPGFAGAGIIVSLTTKNGALSHNARVHRNGRFVRLNDSLPRGQLTETGEQDETPPEVPADDTVIDIIDDLLVAKANTLKFQVYARNSAAAVTDLLPDTGTGALLFNTPPSFPVASVEPLVGSRGTTVNVLATNHVPNGLAVVFR